MECVGCAVLYWVISPRERYLKGISLPLQYVCMASHQIARVPFSVIHAMLTCVVIMNGGILLQKACQNHRCGG